MPRGSSAPFSPLRLFTPIQLAFCLLLFFLPWIELQCVPPKAALKEIPKEQLEEMKKETGIDPTRPVSYLVQSGYQIATGDVSVGSDIKRAAEKKKKKAGGAGGDMEFDLDPETAFKKNKDKEDGSTAPLLFLFPVALVAGIVVAFVPMPTMVRRGVLAGCCALALGVVGVQALIGFPLEKKLKEKVAKEKSGGGQAGIVVGDEQPFRVSWQLPLYLTFLLLLGAAGTSFLGGGGGGRKSKRKVYDFDDEDDEEEEEEERPRKKKKRVVADDDEDDDEPPPRKKSAPASPFEVVEDDEPPKKKPRRRDDDDDEDEDDRPRRKKRRDD